MANKYEMMVVLSPVLGDEGITSTTDAIKAKIETGATIDSFESLGMKRMAYEIQDMKEGYYYFIHFEAEGDQNSEIESRMRIMDGVIRYLCVRQDEA